MSTIAPLHRVTRPITQQQIHVKVLGQTRFYCIEPECDGVHHVWCSCAR